MLLGIAKYSGSNPLTAPTLGTMNASRARVHCRNTDGCAALTEIAP